MDMNTSSFNSHHISTIENRTLSLLPLHTTWIFLLFILSLLGILLTIIILFLFLYFSIRRLNNHLILTNLFICFSVCFIYIIVIFFLIRANELFCGLREFLSQFAYALLYSALLCRYIIQWLATRILSKRTKQFISLLIYILLISIQIPIGILWWYFTIPRVCQQRFTHEYPKLKFHFQQRMSTFPLKSCSYQCIVDYRFYATYTYTIIELFLCTIIAICLFLSHCCHRNKTGKDQSTRPHNSNTLLTFLNMFAFILIDIVWLVWTLFYHFTHPFFVFPSVVIGMFTIGTICLVFILLPQIYFYSKIEMNNVTIPKTILFTNKLASVEDMKDQHSLLHEKYTDRDKQQILSNGSELSYELGASGTFLPITRTPRGPFKVTNTHKTAPSEKPDHEENSMKKERRINSPVSDVTNQQLPIAPLQRQLTSSSLASDFLNPVSRPEPQLHRSRSNIHPSSPSMYYSSCITPHHDETIIPILCNSQRHQVSTPVKMRMMVKAPPSSVPTTRRIYSGTDRRYIRHPHRRILPFSQPSTPLYYPSSKQQYLFLDPYETIPSYSSSNLWQSTSPSSHRHPYSHRRLYMDNRSLSQRLWDIDSIDDEDEIEENIITARGRTTPTIERLKDFRTSRIENDDHPILHIDDDEEEENSFNRKIVHV